MESRTQVVSVELANGKIIQVQVAMLGGEEDVAFSNLSFQGVTDAIEGISKALIGTMDKIKPRKASIEFGVEMATESGQLTALLVKGSGTASLKVVLEWSNE